MSYVRFDDFQKLHKVFDLDHKSENLFEGVLSIEPSVFLQTAIEIANKVGFKTDKEIAERIVSSVLLEVTGYFEEDFNLYSGHDLDVDIDKGLKGEIDFMITYGKHQYYPRNPVFSLVASQWISVGLPQSIAQLIGIQANNEKEKEPKVIDYFYGCATNGKTWEFFKLKNNQIIMDNQRHQHRDIAVVLGIFKHIFENFKTQLQNDNNE